MKKIPTLFVRDFTGDPSRVLNEVHPECQWVLDGEGLATQKVDGTAVLIREGKAYKRRVVKKGKPLPDGFELVETDEATGKTVGWVPVGDCPEDKWHMEAILGLPVGMSYVDGTYELIGPKIQGNPERAVSHRLRFHRHPGLVFEDSPPRDFEGLKKWLEGKNIEGIVFHHSDGRMAKIKLRDFGFKRVVK